MQFQDMLLYVQARTKIAKRGEQIGLDFDGAVEALKGAADWDAELASIRDPTMQLPAYYTQPFHAYPEGNLCWEAALQVLALPKLLFEAAYDKYTSSDISFLTLVKQTLAECLQRYVQELKLQGSHVATPGKARLSEVCNAHVSWVPASMSGIGNG